MRNAIWFVLIICGVIVTSFGLGVMNPVDVGMGTALSENHLSGGVLLIISGLLTCAFGISGLLKCLKYPDDL